MKLIISETTMKLIISETTGKPPASWRLAATSRSFALGQDMIRTMETLD
jgi:hypothetical protein